MSDLTRRGALTKSRERRAYPVELQVKRAKSSAGPAVVEGYASVTEAPYEMSDWAGPYTEVIRGGAFAKTLAENPPVQLLLNHGGLSMAYTRAGSLDLAEDDHGLHMRAEVNPARSDVNDMLIALDDGAVDEMSFAFVVTRQLWSPDWSQRDINEVSMHKGDVSVVNFGANDATDVGVSRSRRAAVRRDLRALARRAASKRTLTGDDALIVTALLAQLAAADAGLDPFVDALCAADGVLDLSQQTLAAMLGIPDPDQEDDTETDDMGAASAAARSRIPSPGKPVDLAAAELALLQLR